MKCPKCGKRLNCVDSRSLENYTRRRYVCPNCNEKISTKEFLSSENVNVYVAKEIKTLIDKINDSNFDELMAISVLLKSANKINF
mgnify:CR=1 FL=1